MVLRVTFPEITLPVERQEHLDEISKTAKAIIIVMEREDGFSTLVYMKIERIASALLGILEENPEIGVMMEAYSKIRMLSQIKDMDPEKAKEMFEKLGLEIPFKQGSENKEKKNSSVV
jgi:HEAT repeat protein